MKRLVDLFDKYDCDKGSKRHRYDRVYEPTLEHLKDKKFRLLEIGIFKGLSIQAWIDYFPNAEIYGIDIFARITPEELETLKHPRISWCKCDSINGPFDEFNKMIGRKKFDVIIDDGMHTHDAQRKTFENFFPHLKKNGLYFIEDVWAFDVMTGNQKQHKWLKQHPNDFSNEQYEQLKKALMHHGIKYHDLRKGYHDDTFIIEIRK